MSLPYEARDPRIERRISAALEAHDRGWALTPIIGKRPIRTGWQKEPRQTREEAQTWAEHGNVALRTGKASGIVVIDDDTADGEGARSLDLPITPTVRTGGGHSHYYFAYGDDHIGCSTSRIASKVDVKGEGGAVASVGSIHPETDQMYEWAPGLSPNDVPLAPFPTNLGERLRKPNRKSKAPRSAPHATPEDERLRRYAEAAFDNCVDTVSQAPEGARNDELNRQAFIVGRFIGAGLLDRSSAEQRLGEAARFVGLGDTESQATLRSGLQAGIDDPHRIEDLVTRISKGSHLPTSDGYGEDLPPDPKGRPRILVKGGTLHETVTRAEEIFLASSGDQIYQRGGMLTRLVRTASLSIRDATERRPGALMLLPVDAVYLADRLTELIAFFRWDARSQDYRAIDCPERIAKTLLARAGRWKARTIIGIVEAPTLRPDGTILDTPGYDEQTRLYFDPGGVIYPPIPDQPNLDDARSAVAILKYLIKDFPWVAASDCSAVLALFLTVLMRLTLRAAPLFVLRAPTMASGKSLLADCAAMIATGRTAPAMAQGQNDEEDRKRILAVLMEGQPVACVDNVERPLGGPALCSVLTQETWRDRVLGVSRTVSVPTAVTWIATGNNIIIVGDLVSRVVPCDIDPRVEHPEERSFEIKPREYVLQHRAELVVAALTILRAYHVAGLPDQGLSVFGRFEDWSDLIRSALVWAGEVDPCEGRKRLRRIDPIGRHIQAVLEHWHEALGSREVSTHEVIRAATAEPEKAERAFYACLWEVAAGEGGIDARRLGHWLARHERRREGGLHVERAGERQGVALWMVVRGG
jgi:bifunctional DNA primase/polymerase-like protein